MSRQWNEFYSLESVKTPTFSFQISKKGKGGKFKASTTHYSNVFTHRSSLSSKGLSFFHRGNASGGLDSSSVSFGDWLTVFMLIEKLPPWMTAPLNKAIDCCDSEVLTALSLSLWQDSSWTDMSAFNLNGETTTTSAFDSTIFTFPVRATSTALW